MLVTHTHVFTRAEPELQGHEWVRWLRDKSIQRPPGARCSPLSFTMTSGGTPEAGVSSQLKRGKAASADVGAELYL